VSGGARLAEATTRTGADEALLLGLLPDRVWEGPSREERLGVGHFARRRGVARRPEDTPRVRSDVLRASAVFWVMRLARGRVRVRVRTVEAGTGRVQQRVPPDDGLRAGCSVFAKSTKPRRRLFPQQHAVVGVRRRATLRPFQQACEPHDAEAIRMAAAWLQPRRTVLYRIDRSRSQFSQAR
jgi:hypothetical protein